MTDNVSNSSVAEDSSISKVPGKEAVIGPEDLATHNPGYDRYLELERTLEPAAKKRLIRKRKS